MNKILNSLLIITVVTLIPALSIAQQPFPAGGVGNDAFKLGATLSAIHVYEPKLPGAGVLSQSDLENLLNFW